ncbi:MAG: septum site-determining protein MinC [Chloroflexi bacterium]|nr:septum site-determining protein MinC [Chloroflexota bacterium]
MKNETAPVTLRGTRDGVLIVLGEGDWRTVMAELERQLARPNASAFFRGARVSIETGNRFLQQAERNALEALLAAYNIHIGSMAPSAPQSPPAPKERDDTYTRRNGATEVLMIRRTLRSGQVIYHEGPVVVYGDVNDGAEIIATGDVLVFGKLRGVVHAGAHGDDHATIGALGLNPPQIRIGNHIAASPEIRGKKMRGPEMACVRGERIVIEPWRV